jgi:hypothetical protein
MHLRFFIALPDPGARVCHCRQTLVLSPGLDTLGVALGVLGVALLLDPGALGLTWSPDPAALNMSLSSYLNAWV